MPITRCRRGLHLTRFFIFLGSILDLLLVTNNTKEFERVEGLRLDNWV